MNQSKLVMRFFQNPFDTGLYNVNVFFYIGTFYIWCKSSLFEIYPPVAVSFLMSLLAENEMKSLCIQNVSPSLIARS